ncbi:MAG: acyl--CoA ligase [Alphaproteobacteria bacterium]|nr:acyl--CoA ligase [Alphaproteobacteria bacterium]
MPTRDEIVAELTGPNGQFALETIRSGDGSIRIYKNAPGALRDLLLTTRTFGDRPFLIFEDEVLTFSTFLRHVASLAGHLQSVGVKKGDRVAIGMRNYPEWVTCFWACQSIGAIAVALNAWWTGPELEYGLSDSGTSVLIADMERFERIESRLAHLKLSESIVVRGSSRSAQAFSEIVAKEREFPAVEIAPEDYSTILYTSGTTGRSKGAVATQRNHVTNIMNTLLGATVQRLLAGAEAPPADFQAGALQTFPFFHIGGLTGLYVATVTGTKLALMFRWDPRLAVELVAKHALNSVAGVPYVVRQLLESARSAGQSLPSLAGVAAGGAPVPPDLIRTVGSQFETKVSPGNGYGLTETTSAVIVNSGKEYFSHPDSVGRPVPTADARVVDDNSGDCETGTIGEIWIRGPNVIPGYWRNPEATEQAFGGGWFRTGDLGYRDANGLYYVVDRKKDVIIRGGENVYCVEVETALLEHPMVRDVGVLGLPHPELGEIVACVIQPAGEVAPETLSAHLEGTLAKFKIPTRYAFTAEELPRTATGKLLKREMRTKFFQS